MKAIFVIALSLGSFSASADYFKAGIGYSLGGKVKLDNNGAGPSSIDLDNNFISPLLLAYGFEMMGDVHGEVEVAYSKNDYDVTGATNEPTVLTGAFNIVGNAPLGAVTLTGGAGVTFGSYDSDLAGADAGTAFGLQLFGGMDFPVSEAMKIGAEFRYMTTVTKFDLGSDVDGSYNNTSLIINAKFGM